jgi:hypothetical protein
MAFEETLSRNPGVFYSKTASELGSLTNTPGSFSAEIREVVVPEQRAQNRGQTAVILFQRPAILHPDLFHNFVTRPVQSQLWPTLEYDKDYRSVALDSADSRP